ncbi:MAG: Eco57I restriction-modification methylase domain-containing protein [Bacteroidales bacterium]|nr:Eco57I restriction-modification methylase domain-containing protein [Candidatus Colicola equi]
MAVLQATREYTLIYIFSVPYPDHEGLLKIGKASVSVPEDFIPEPNDPMMVDAARVRIKQELNTGGFKYDLLYTELAYYKNEEGKGRYFDDHDVHAVLENSGYKKHIFDASTADEWYPVDLTTAQNAIKAVKEERQSLEAPKHSIPEKEIEFREEQDDAVRRTLIHFEYGNKMLWNAKMRFGKTLCALETVRRMNCKRTLILTHRPAVRDGWFEDFDKIKFENYQRGTKPRHDGSVPPGGFGQDFKTLERDLQKTGKHYIYFISMQDLRGSKETGGKFDKNAEIFSAPWDLVILDEAHEGTQTTLGKKVIQQLNKKSPKFLYLSGTPFNILNQFEGQEIYTWDYVREQEAKETWDEKHPGVKNPYEGLPRLNMLTYSLGSAFEHYKHAEDDYFNFTEFFRVWKGDIDEDGEEMPLDAIVGDFVHKDDVRLFLDLLSKDDAESNYPFAHEVFRHYFEHTFWVVPGVKAAAALTLMLNNHPIFRNYAVVNVAGDGHTLAMEDVDATDIGDDTLENIEKKAAEIKAALTKVKKAIAENEKTITISCGRLTTGVTVPEWTAVLMLAGSYSTKAASYMQTIFRVQSPATDGTIKRECYAFDFAPDRTVTVVEDFLNVTRKLNEGKSGEEATERENGHHDDAHARYIGKFMHYCPIIAIDGSQTKAFDTLSFMKQVHRAIADQIYRQGFNSHRLFMGFDEVSKEDLERLTGIESLFGNANNKAMSNEGKINVNDQGMTGEDGSSEEGDNDGEKSNTTNKPKNTKKPRNNYAESLRRYRQLMGSIAKRFPLLLFGAIDSTEHWSLVNFVHDMDREDWEQFMPKGFTQEKFLEVSHLFNNDYFLTSTQLLLEDTHNADELPVEERVMKMAHILQRFHYPDKETVLTPWRVVNLHMTETIGGYSFFKDANYTKETTDPILIENVPITKEIFAKDSKLLEINSKSGIYPLWLAYTLFRYRCAEQPMKLTEEQKLGIWNQILSEQLFVLCKTPMARRITERVLRGYRSIATRCNHERDLIEILKNDEQKTAFVEQLKQYSYWGIENMATNNFEFKAVVGNPPYQQNIENRSEQPPVYHLFYDLAFELSPIATLITPGRFLFNAGKTPSTWNQRMLNDTHLKVVRYNENSKVFFQNVDIKGGVAICMRNLQEEVPPIGNYAKNNQIRSILEKVLPLEHSLSEIVYSNTSYKFSPLFFKENPSLERKVSGGSKRYLSSPAFAKFGKVLFSQIPNDGSQYALIYGRAENQRISYFFNEKYLVPPSNYKKYKVFVASTNGTGSIGETLADPFVGKPNEGATETFITIGDFNTQIEAENLLKYLKTRFARLMLATKKVTQGNKNPKVWNNIPLQDFSESSDIKWSRSIDEIDKQLYAKYNLSEEDTRYIDMAVKKMQ